MGVPSSNENLFGHPEMIDGDRPLAIGHHGVDQLAGQGVDQPGLAPGELVGGGFGVVGKHLAGVFGVLIQKGGDLFGGKARQAQGVQVRVATPNQNLFGHQQMICGDLEGGDLGGGEIRQTQGVALPTDAALSIRGFPRLLQSIEDVFRRPRPLHRILIGGFLYLTQIRSAPIPSIPIHMVADLVVEQVLDIKPPQVRQSKNHVPPALGPDDRLRTSCSNDNICLLDEDDPCTGVDLAATGTARSPALRCHT